MYDEIAICDLIPSAHNVRSQTIQDDGYIDLLANNIRQYGLLHPISVLDLKDGRYEILAGLRRVKALQQLGWIKVPCFVLNDTHDAFCLSFSENMQRNNMLKRDICRAIERYLQMHNDDISEVARIMQLTVPTVKRYANLARLSDEILYRLDAQDKTRLTMQEAEAMMANHTDVPLHAVDALVEGEQDDAPLPKKERKKPLKSEPWVYGLDDAPTAIPPHLQNQVWKLIEMHIEK
jgi:ParB/RepB/Spo0J family partition protein